MDPPVDSYPVPGTLDETLGFELLEAGPDRVRGRFAAEKRVQQPFGLVHGGAYMALAESMASVATFEAVAGDGNGDAQAGGEHHAARGHPHEEGRRHRQAQGDDSRVDRKAHGDGSDSHDAAAIAAATSPWYSAAGPSDAIRRSVAASSGNR